MGEEFRKKLTEEPSSKWEKRKRRKSMERAQEKTAPMGKKA